MKRSRQNLSLSLLIICCICPFILFGCISTNKTQNVPTKTDLSGRNAVSWSRINSDTICTQQDLDFESAGTYLPHPWQRQCCDENSTDNDLPSIILILQRLVNEFLAAAVVYLTGDIIGPTTPRRRPPKYIKKQLPGLKRKRWKMMTTAFSENGLLRDIFFGRHRNVKNDINAFLEMIFCVLKLKATMTLAHLVFWVRYAIFFTRYRISLLKLNTISYMLLQRYRMLLYWERLMLFLRAVRFCLCYPFKIYTSPRKIVLCYVQMILIVVAPCDRDLWKPPSYLNLKFRPNKLRHGPGRLLFVLILVSRFTLVAAPNNGHDGCSFPTSIGAAGIGTGIATVVSCIVEGKGYTVRRTPRWKASESNLKERCMVCGVEYITPPLSENKQQQVTRRDRLRKECDGKEMERRHLEMEDDLKKRCLEIGEEYTPPALNESASERRVRINSLRRKCETAVKKAERLSRQGERTSKKRRKESAAETAKRQRRNAVRMRNARKALTPAKRAEQLRANKEASKKSKAKRKKEVEGMFREDDEFIDGEVPRITVSTEGAKRARELLLRTTTNEGAGDAQAHHHHRANGCVVCDEFIIGTEEVYCITKDQLQEHKDRLSAEAYEEYYGGQPIDEVLRKQYEICGMEGMLLSRRFGKDNASHFTVCSRCKSSLNSGNVDKSPPKYSIANGFLIGSIPKVIEFTNENGEEESLKTITEVVDGDGNPIPSRNESKVSSIMAAAISPTRPYAYIFSYRGGRHQSLIGNFQFFETDQTKVAGALKCLHESGMASNIYVVVNGAMTPSQKDIVRKKAELDTHLYFGLLRWFKQHHPGFRDVVVDESSELKVELIEDPPSDANTDESVDPGVEEKEEGATFYFSSGGEPTADTSVFKTSKELVVSLLKNRSAPTLTICGGNYASHLDVMHLEKVFPTIFPFGSGGPTLERRNKISDEEIIRHYLRLSLPQFLESEFVLVANFLLGRILSYKSAVMKCRPLVNQHGVAVGDIIGTMTIEEIKAAIEEEHSSENSNSTASKFLKAVSASCRHLGVTEEAAKQARRKCFSLQDFFGMHSLFVTITIDDECSFRVRLYPHADANGEGTLLPSVDSPETECIADLTFRKKTRRKYPGACALEYESAMQIALECLFGWDNGRQRGRRGLFGIMEAFCRADEEQNRGSLHGHWLVWIKNFGHLRRLMFAEDEKTRELARAEYIDYVNKVMCARQCELEVKVTHTCCNGDVKDLPNEIFDDRDSTVFREARHEDGCRAVKGNVLWCDKCKKELSPSDITKEMLSSLQEDESVTPFPYPISRERLDIIAYRTIYDVLDECGNDADSAVRCVMLHERFNQHLFEHVPSCFKKGCDCRHLFPYLTNIVTRIYEGRVPITVKRHILDGSVHEENRFVVDVERPQGCQYMNVHNRILSYIFTCNSNVQAGDSGQTFYQTLYNCKNTQPEDRETRDIVAKSVIRRLLRAQREKEQCELLGDEIEEEVNTWVEGLSRVLSGINAATSRTVISAPMAHNIASNLGTRFHFSHEFAELLVGQMCDVVEGKEGVSCIIRKCKEKEEGEELKQWADISANDYIYRHSDLNELCFYHQTMYYAKGYKQDGLASDTTTSTSTLMFEDGHPGKDFAYLAKVKHVKIPNTSIPEGKLCRIEELDINNDTPSASVIERREEYAKTALLMFCPFRELDELQHERSYWEKFDLFRKQYFQTEGKLRYEDKRRNFDLSPSNLDLDTVKKDQYLRSDVAAGSFWVKGFEILQNIEDRLSIEKSQGRAQDVVSDEAELPEKYIEGDVSCKDDVLAVDDLEKDIAFYCEQFEGDEQWEEGEVHRDIRYSHERLLNSDITHDRIVKARLASDESIISHSNDPAKSKVDDTSDMHTNQGLEERGDMPGDGRAYANVIQLIRGSLVGGGGNYDDVYQTDEDEDDVIVSLTINSPQKHGGAVAVDTSHQIPVPTLAGIARRVSRDENKRLDEKQYIMYEVISCSFLLGLLNEVTDQESNEHLSLQGKLGTTIGQKGGEDLEILKRELRKRGGREQLLMFVTGFAGAGKSTAIKVAQTFCYEFCKAASIMWADNTFLFTAYTGSAAAAFGGLTTVKATYIGKKGTTPRLTDDEIKAFEGVRILIIDETSFLKECELLKLDRTLKKIANDRRPFGGYSIIFSGDFQQNEPVKMKNSDKLWHPESSMHFEHNINCAIILDGIHRFKDDETYGRILQRLCRGEMTQADVDKINERYVGVGGVTLPKKLDGDTCYACETNKQRNAISAAIFREHLRKTHPRAGDSNDPPRHTIIIKGFVESSTSSHAKIGAVLRRRIIELGDSDMRQEQKLISPHLCCYNGAYFMCNSNDNLKEHGTGNGTQARLVRLKLKENPTSYRCEDWDGRKVWTVCATDVEYAEFEHNHGEGRRFRLTPKKFSVKVNVSPHDMTSEKVSMKCSVTQLPVNASDAITGHKLQGLTKDNVIVCSWNRSTNWIYVVLSRVRTLSGLYLFHKLKLQDIKQPSRDYLAFMRRMRLLERNELDRAARNRMSSDFVV